MRANARQSHDAGIELLGIADEYKQLRSELSDKAALKLAMLADPDLAEYYLGRSVRRGSVAAVLRFLGYGIPTTPRDIKY